MVTAANHNMSLTYSSIKSPLRYSLVAQRTKSLAFHVLYFGGSPLLPLWHLFYNFLLELCSSGHPDPPSVLLHDNVILLYSCQMCCRCVINSLPQSRPLILVPLFKIVTKREWHLVIFALWSFIVYKLPPLPLLFLPPSARVLSSLPLFLLCFSGLEIEPRTLWMLGKESTTTPYPQALHFYICFYICN